MMRRRLAPLLAAAALVLGVRAVAEAHAMLVSAEPAAGAHLASAPSRVRLVFSEALELSLAELSLTDDSGRTVRLKATGDPRDVHALIAPVASIAPGSYRVTWRVVSADGHPVEGSYVFTIGAAAAAPPPAQDLGASRAAWGPTVAGAPIAPALSRGIAIGALMSLAGLLLFVAWPGNASGASAGRADRLARNLALATVAVLVLNIVTWAINAVPEHRLTSESLAAALATVVGRVELWRTGLALLAAWALWVARRSRLALVFAAAAVAVSGAGGHSAAIHPLWNVPAKSIHLLAASAWIGGLLWLLSSPREDGATFVRAAARISTVALCAVLMVALSGVVQTLLILPSPLDVVRSAYGAVVLAKVAGLLMLVAFGAQNRFRIMPAMARDAAAGAQLQASVRREMAVMAAVVLLAGLLAFVPPPGGPPASSPTTAQEP
ncbi:MAG: copper resistance protein CopC [Gemmatimonadales bacterium]